MQKKVGILLVPFIYSGLAILTIMFASVSAATAQSPKFSEITEISLSYGESHFAALSSFTIVLRRNGTATYSGEKKSSREGDYVGTFDKREFIKLAKLIVEHGYFFLDDSCVKDNQDGGMTTTRVRYAGGEKRIKNNSWRKSNGDDRLPDIENAIAGIDQRILIKWRPAASSAGSRSKSKISRLIKKVDSLNPSGCYGRFKPASMRGEPAKSRKQFSERC